MTDRENIAQYYDEHADYEYARLERSPLHESEWLLSRELLDEYITPGTSVLDLGAGPGRYAEYLIRQKRCFVGVVDLSRASLDLFLRRLDETAKARVLFAREGCATAIDDIREAQFDAVLLMGPLYHLLTDRERIVAVHQSHRVLKPGGILFAAFVSPYYLVRRALLSEPSILDSPEIKNAFAGDGFVPLSLHENFTDHWCCWPHQAKTLMEQNGFETLRLRNLEGLGSFLRDEQTRMLQDVERKQAWFNLLRLTCENPDLLGATIHFAYVGIKTRQT